MTKRLMSFAAAFSLVAHGGHEFVPGQLVRIALKAVNPLEQVLIRSLPEVFGNLLHY